VSTAADRAAASSRIGRRVSVSGSHSAFRVAAVAGDAAVALFALYGAFLLRTQIPIPGTEKLLPPGNVRFEVWNLTVVVVVQVFSLSFLGLYGEHERFREPLGRLLLPALFLELLTLASIYFLAPAYSFPRSLVVLYVVVNGLLLALWRSALDRLFPLPRRRALVVGRGAAADLIAQTIRRHPWSGVEVVGHVAETERNAAGPARAADDGGPAALPFLGPIERLAEIVEEERIDEVILTPEGPTWRDRISEGIPEGWRADLLVWPSPFETMIGRLRFRIVGDLPLLEARTRPFEPFGALAKRAFDLLISAIMLVLLTPVLAVAALAVAGTSVGGVFYRQTRVGKEGRLFQLWKLRTMRKGAEIETGAVLASPGDPRMTRIGRALRSARIDEIPQLWNVLVGDMSLVGPRPERPEFTGEFAESVPGWTLRHSVRPGLTGLAQVSGEYSTEPEIKLRYDLAYLNNWSFGLDLSILLRTLRVILTRRGV
jgi:exopolysaccharide biosynthesis polyprenyl glycosylphosphotransferase